MFELIVFDLDGVLVDSEGLASTAVAEELCALGLTITAEEVAHRFAGYTDSALARVLSEERGVPVGDGFPERVATRAIRRIEAGELPPMPGVADMLQELARWPRCVASNSAPARIDAALAATGLAAFFPRPRRFSARHVGRPKPAPDLHLFAAARLGARAQHTLVIEDSPTGVQAGVAAGMTVIGFTGASHLPPGQDLRLRDAGAIEVVDDFARLPALLREVDS